MEDLEQRLNSLLSDPESLSRLTELAGNFLGNVDETKKGDSDKQEKSDTSDSGPEFDLATFAKISGMLNGMREDSEDSRLLLALKPYLRDKRKEKVDETVKLMKLMKLAPLFKEIKF